VVSQGGIAGVGETLRRLPWTAAKVQSESVVVTFDAEAFEQLEELSRDQWPAR
jgi:hypothetical protein